MVFVGDRAPGCTFGVVEMDGSEVVEPHLLIKLIKHDLHSPLSGQVVAYRSTSTARYHQAPQTFTTAKPSPEGISSLLTLPACSWLGSSPNSRRGLTCGEGVAGVQTHPHSGLVSHFVYDAPQLGELAAHRCALTAHVLQH